MNKKHINELKEIHSSIKPQIETRLRDFKKIWKKGSDNELFIELAFCIFTPQSGARVCWKAVSNLIEKDLLFNGNFQELRDECNIVRFRNNKSRYLIEAREKFVFGERPLRSYLNDNKTVYEKREWIVKNVKGIGYKEASHFLRNVGFGDNIAILDRHILRNMNLLGLIKEIPKSITQKNYISLENSLKEFSEEVAIPLCHLDFVLWYKETGDIFK